MKPMALSLGVTGGSYLEAHEWEASVAYRWLHINQVFSGDQVVTGFNNTGFSESHSVAVTATYALTRRFSLSLTLPFVYGEHHWAYEHSGASGHGMTAAGLSDVTLVGNAWVLDPAKHSEGNIALSLGVKAPTGDDNARDISYQATGPVVRPVDQSIQPGDGGWGIVLQMQAFQKVFQNTYLYAAGFYLVNPREKNGTELVLSSYYGDGVFYINGVPDQYLARAGLSYTLWPEKGFSVSLGGRLEGIPVRDLVGGGDNGFRRPGYTISLEPGLNLTRGKNTFTLSAPVRLDLKTEQSVLERQLSAATGTRIPGGAAVGDFAIQASYSRKF